MQIIWTQGDVQHFLYLTPQKTNKIPPENNLLFTHHCAFVKITVNLPYVLQVECQLLIFTR